MHTQQMRLSQDVFDLGVPLPLTSEQIRICSQITDWINRTCLKNPNWDGSDKYEAFETQDQEVFRKIQEWCQEEGRISFYFAFLPDGRSMVGVVAPM